MSRLRLPPSVAALLLCPNVCLPLQQAFDACVSDPDEACAVPVRAR